MANGEDALCSLLRWRNRAGQRSIGLFTSRLKSMLCEWVSPTPAAHVDGKSHAVNLSLNICWFLSKISLTSNEAIKLVCLKYDVTKLEHAYMHMTCAGESREMNPFSTCCTHGGVQSQIRYPIRLIFACISVICGSIQLILVSLNRWFHSLHFCEVLTPRC